ncbi:kelch-like protein 2 [Ciona intestinalis]
MADSVHLTSNKHFEFVMAMLGRQRLNERYCDVTLVVEDQTFPAHRAILAASSKYFDRMFYSQMSEQFNNKIQIKEVTKAAMTQVINFIYTNQVSLSNDNFYEVLHAASLMQLEDLLELIIKYLQGAIGPKNCLHYRQIGKLYSLHDLVAKCNECIEENFDEISVQKKFMEIEVDAVGKFLASDELMVKSEEGIYKILVAWVKHDLQCRKEYFPTLFNHLRLQYVCLDYLSKTIRKEELVREFHDCRDLVEDAFYFHVNPTLFEKQKPRKLCLPFGVLTFVPKKDQNIAQFNIQENKWSSLGETGSHTILHLIVLDGMVYCFGKVVGPGVHTNISLRFNGKEWEHLAPMICNSIENAPIACIQGEIFLFGGSPPTSFGGNCSNYISKYNPTSNTWTNVGKVDYMRPKATAVGVNECAYHCGGNVITTTMVSNGKMKVRSQISVCCSKVNIYNTVKKTWTSGNNMIEARALCAAVFVDGKIFVFGGFGENKAPLLSGEFMNIADGVWTMLKTNIPYQLGEATACCVGDYIAVYGSSTPGHVALYNIRNDEWKTFKEDGQNLFTGEGCLMAT